MGWIGKDGSTHVILVSVVFPMNQEQIKWHHGRVPWLNELKNLKKPESRATFPLSQARCMFVKKQQQHDIFVVERAIVLAKV